MELNTAQFLNPKLFSSEVEKISNRDGYGDGVVTAGEKDENVMVLTADLSESTRSNLFAKKFPERFVQMGVAEQNMAGVAAGLALSGKVAFMASYAVFSPGRNWDQIRVSICYSKANVKIIGCHTGFSVGPDGATHQALEDIALTRVLPNLKVIVPADYHEARKATLEAAKTDGPVYIRLAREKTPVITTQNSPFAIGKARVLTHGTDVSVIVCGAILWEVLVAVKALWEQHKISCEVINCSTIKPLDHATIVASVHKTKRVVSVEEHQIFGGLGSAISEQLSEKSPTKMKMIGVNDSFGESGTYEELKKKYGLDSEGVADKILKFVKEA